MRTIRLPFCIMLMLMASAASSIAARSAMAPDPTIIPFLPQSETVPVEPPQPEPQPLPFVHGAQPEAHNIIYTELVTMALNGSLTLNYERVINPYVAIRVGYGVAGAVFSEHSGESFSGAVASAMLMTGGDHKLEVDCGVSLLAGGNFYGTFLGESRGLGRPTSFTIEPALGIGYRYQPSDGGFFFRLGAGWTLFYGLPVQISAGYVF